MENLEKISNPKETQEELKTPQELKLEEIRKDVKETCDRLGMPIDPGIEETVVMFKANGLPTSMSCEGHPDRGLIAPSITVSAPGEPDERYVGEREIIKEVAEKYNVTTEAVERAYNEEAWKEAMRKTSDIEETEEYKKWDEENKVLLEKMHTLIDEFYQDREVEPDRKLKIIAGAGHFDVHNGREDYQSVIEKKQEFTEEEIKERAKKVLKYRDEMNDFTDFLKEKFGESFSN